MSRSSPLTHLDDKPNQELDDSIAAETALGELRETRFALEREQKKLANLAVFAPAVFYSFCKRPDGTSCVPYASPNLADLCGINPEEVLHDASSLFDSVHLEDRQRVMQSVEYSAKTMSAWHGEFRIRHPRKGERWIEGSATITQDPDGSLVWYGFVTDISDRKRFETDQNFLLQLDSNLQSANSSEAIVAVATRMLATHFCVPRCSLSSINLSRKEAPVLGVYADGVVSYQPATHPWTTWGFERGIAHLSEGNTMTITDTSADPLTAPHYANTFEPLGITSFLIVPLLRAGQWVAVLAISHSQPRTWVQREVDLARVAAERIWPAYEAARAVAAERLTNESLAVSEERLRCALQSGSLGIWEQNYLTRKIYWDERAKSIFGFPLDLQVTWNAIMSRVHPDDLDAAREAIQVLVDANGTGRFEFVHRLKVSGEDVEPRHIFAQGQTYFSGEGANRRPVRSIGTVQDITERKLSEAKLRRSLEEKQILLQEVHHRVKNNLQIISSLLSMQSNLIEDKLAVAKLVDSERRVRSMAMIHEHLYRQEDMSSIDLFEYARDLVAELFYSISGNPLLTFRFEGSPVIIALEQAIPCGLMLNELITNAVKYAYPDGGGEILIKLSSDDEFVSLSVSDYGIGLPSDFNPNTSQSLGMTIVQVLTQQLDGDLEINGSSGASFTARFPNRRRVCETGGSATTGPPKRRHAIP